MLMACIIVVNNNAPGKALRASGINEIVGGDIFLLCPAIMAINSVLLATAVGQNSPGARAIQEERTRQFFMVGTATRSDWLPSIRLQV